MPEFDTSQVLTDCLTLLSTPTHESYPSSNIPSSRFESHPEIQYFKDIKDKNHYEYHKTKNAKKLKELQKLSGTSFPADSFKAGISGFNLTTKTNVVSSDSCKPTINPHDRNSLLERISTFNVLNWQLPRLSSTHADTLNELLCARKGWKCVSKPAGGFSDSALSKNVLRCSSCHSTLQLKFNDSSSASNASYFPFDFDEDDYVELNDALAENYINQIKVSGHDSNCLWRIYETPLEGVYYSRPYIEDTNKELIADYLKNLKALVDNLDLIVEHKGKFKSINSEIVEDFMHDANEDDFIRKSNSLLVDRYYKADQENSYYDIQFNNSIPKWIYRIALLGWLVHVQSFSSQLVILLICKKCNSRTYLNSISHVDHSSIIDSNGNIAGVSVSPSRILTPCKYPALIQPSSTHSIYDVDEDAEEEAEDDDFSKIDIVGDHKSWCCYTKESVAGKSLECILVDLILQEEATDSHRQKRRKSFDINENLEKLNKLRKVFLQN